MTSVNRIRIGWTGAPVTGGGVSTFYTVGGDVSVFTAALKTFFGSFNALFPSGLTIVYPPGGETLDELSGEVIGTWSMTPLSPTAGAGALQYAAGVGMRVRWNTAAITRGRRVRGSTYLVPIGNLLYGSDGTIDNASLALVQGACATLIASDGGSMRVYSRPVTIEKPAGTFTDYPGSAHPVLSGTAVDQVSWLRSRRT